MVAPEIYNPYVVIEKLKKLLCYKSQNNIYGTLKAAFILDRNLITYLLGFGIEINPYDVCVANKIVKKRYNIISCEQHKNIASLSSINYNINLMVEIEIWSGRTFGNTKSAISNIPNNKIVQGLWEFL